VTFGSGSKHLLNLRNLHDDKLSTVKIQKFFPFYYNNKKLLCNFAAELCGGVCKNVSDLTLHFVADDSSAWKEE